MKKCFSFNLRYFNIFLRFSIVNINFIINFREISLYLIKIILHVTNSTEIIIPQINKTNFATIN